MNTNEEMKSVVPGKFNVAARCIAGCKKLLAQIEKARNVVMAEFQGRFGANEQLLRLALNEAEALAWETEFPHLFFPALAKEKAEGMAAWFARQRALRPIPAMALAAA